MMAYGRIRGIAALIVEWSASRPVARVNETSMITGKEIPSRQQDNTRRNPAFSSKSCSSEV
jgi:hypothetical protein